MAYVTAADVYREAGIPSDGSIISDDDVTMHIESAESVVEQLLGTCFQPGGRQLTETYDGDDSNVLFLDHYPVISLDSLSISDGTTPTSVTPSKVYVYNSTGKLQLKTTAEVTLFNGGYPQLVSVTYTYGEAASQRIVHFTALVAAKMTLIQQVGGTFDDVTSYSLPELSANKGEPWTQIRETIQRVSDELKFMLEQGVVRIKPQVG